MHRRPSLLLFALITSLSACGGAPSSEAPSKEAESRPEPPKHEPSANRKPAPTAKFIAPSSNSTMVTVEGTLEAEKDAEFVIGEEEGTLLLAHALTPKAELDVSVYRGDSGDRVADQHPANPAFFVSRLPETLGYLIVVHATSEASPFRLEVESPRRLFFDEATGAADIRVAVPANATVAYIIPPGQKVAAELKEGAADAYLTVQDLDGKLLLKAADKGRSYSGGPDSPANGMIVRLNQGTADGELGLSVKKQ